MTKGQERLSRLTEFVQIPSYSGKEDAFNQRIFDELKTERLDPFFQERNVVALLEGKDRSRAFILLTHSDVVDEGDPALWKSPPFGGQISQGRMWGRGTCDMKAGLEGSMEFLINLKEKGEIPTDVLFVAAVQEETDGLGAKSFGKWFSSELLDKYKQVAVVLPEPTGLTSVLHSHQGNYALELVMEGMAGHAGRPELIHPHAVEDMAELVVAIKQKRNLWKGNHTDPHSSPPRVTTTRFVADTKSANRTAPKAEVYVDIRTIKGFHEEARREIEELVKKHHGESKLLYADTPPGASDPNSNLIRAMTNTIPGLKVGEFMAASDLGPFLSQLPPERKIEAGIWGPGFLSNAHKANESVPIRHVKRMPFILNKFYQEWSQMPAA